MELTDARLDELEAWRERCNTAAGEFAGAFARQTLSGMLLEDAPALLACARREKRLRWLLANLYAMVQGEVPSLLEDHHLAAEIDEALKEE